MSVPTPLTGLVLSLAVAADAAPAGADDLSIVVTSDAEETLAACRSCPHARDAWLRRASLATALAGDGALLVDAGGSLFCAETLPSGGRLAVEAAELAGVDALHLSWRDFRLGLAATRALVEDSEVPFVSTNLLDGASGEPLARPFVVVERGGVRVALLGVTHLPPGLERLPHISAQLAGVEIAAPGDALAEWLPRARERADRAVLLYYGAPAGLAPIAERFGPDLDVIVVGGAPAEALPPVPGPPVVAALRPGHVVRARLVGIGDDPRVELDVTPLDGAIAVDPGLAELLAAHRPGPVPVPATTVPEAEPVAAPTTTGPEAEPVAAPVEAVAPPSRPSEAQERPAPTPPVAQEPVADEAPTAIPDPDDPPRVPRGLAGVGLSAEDVNRAIERGAAFLWRLVRDQDMAGGRSFGARREHVLVALALVHTGLHERDEAFRTALATLVQGIEPRALDTYQVGLLAMLIEASGEGRFLPKLREAARVLVERQGPRGSWTYSCPVPSAPPRPAPREGTLEVFGGWPLDGTPVGPMVARSSAEPGGVDGDSSVSQYALLGLHAATRAGISIADEAWQAGLEAYRARQNGDGGWGYHSRGSSSYGSMTAAGAASIAIAAHPLGDRAGDAAARIDRGLAWLGEHFSVSEHPPAGRQWHYYYLYALERAAQLVGTEFIGDHEWYPRGARYLVDVQRGDGSWVGKGQEEDPRLATSFALLFLERATPRLRGAGQGGEGTLLTAIDPGARTRFYVILDASGSMLDALGDRPKHDIAREVVTEVAGELPVGAELALRAYGHRLRGREAGASEDTELLLPLGPVDAARIATTLEALRARGQTPLALSLEQALDDLAGVSVERPAVLLLLTDGGERTFPARRDPFAAAERLAATAGVELHVIGFDIGRADWSEQLAAIAERGRGRYWPARDAESLLAWVRGILAPAPEDYVVLDGAGQEVARARFGQALRLPEGRYRVRTVFEGTILEEPVGIATDATTSVVLHLPVRTPGTISGPGRAEEERAPRELPATQGGGGEAGAAAGAAVGVDGSTSSDGDGSLSSGVLPAPDDPPPDARRTEPETGSGGAAPPQATPPPTGPPPASKPPPPPRRGPGGGLPPPGGAGGGPGGDARNRPGAAPPQPPPPWHSCTGRLPEGARFCPWCGKKVPEGGSR